MLLPSPRAWSRRQGRVVEPCCSVPK
ncbi:hypothetical protein CMUS01_05013 [Colletotrichum musicola]|uniref:Uncharacterized protein n=1 Tax=Colletotrichum musicola TaxID=2175873 RepID=A0A8H6KUQ5_9PEZI|nr:hypothetical protein CMUS01_05013 [Colletotrichum musicola]